MKTPLLAPRKLKKTPLLSLDNANNRLASNGNGNAKTNPLSVSTKEIFRSIAENSPDIILCLESSGRFLFANACSESLFGIKPELLIGKKFSEIGLPDSLCSFWKKLINNALGSINPIERDFVLQSPLGIRHYEVRAIPGQGGVENTSLVITTIRDATRRRLRDSEVFEIGQRLLYHTNNSPLAIMEFSTQGRCLAWNHKAEEFFGQPQHECGKPLTSCLPLIYPEDRDRFEEIHDRLQGAQQASAFASARFMHRNGAVAHGEWYLSALLDDDGVCRSILCFLNDVTDREKAEQALIRINEDQEQILLARTTMLRRINDELQQEISARKGLELDLIRISEREHRRLGHDLHDGICQELAGIHFSVQAIAKRLGTPVLKQLEAIVEAIHRTMNHTRLLSRGLAPVELESGNLITALAELAADTQALFQIDCVLESHEVPETFPPETCSNLYRIAQEAIQNAIKHGKATRIRISLDCQNRHGVMTITDNGNGMDSTKPGDAEGNGMGLHIMKHRAELIHGSVSVLAHNGGGTMVHCVFQK
jgi:PAS domain S-box-containing protein